jgi:crotonobetainyl-CoA:carnitine CoA-transferase CaiB-like acyl-CoA transferase
MEDNRTAMPEENSLSDLRVLDLSDRAAGAYCAMLFAGYGADVILVEPPGGNSLRNLSAWPRLAAGKRSLTLDLTTATGHRIFSELVEGATLVVETFTDGALEQLGLGFENLQAIKRRIVLTSIKADARAGDIASFAAGLNAFAASAIASFNADAYEIPQHVEISTQECLASATALGLTLPARLEGAPFESGELPWLAGEAPRLGGHTSQVLCEDLGLAPADLPKLRAAGVI